MPAPTPRQQEIRDYEGLGLLITAPAGCGKTEALALRVRGLIDRGATSHPRRILILTFTNRAKENIEERLRNYLTHSEVRRHVTISNLHSFAARVIRAHGNVIGVDHTWAIPDSDWVGEQLRALGIPSKQREIVKGYLQEAKLTTRTDAEVLTRIAQSQHPLAIQLEQKRVAEKRLTYDDLPRLADLILRDDGVAALYREHFSSLIIDEFQDLTLQQLSIAQRIGASRITYAGDLAQGIYSFAGANPQMVLDAARAEGIQEIAFAESHRSSPAVLNLVNSLTPMTDGTVLSSSRPESWPGGGLTGHRTFETVEDEAAWIADFAAKIIPLAPSHRIGVVTRVKARREALDSILNEDGHPFSWYRWDDPIFDSHTAPILRSLLRRATDSMLRADDAVKQILELVDPVELHDPTTLESVTAGCTWIQELSIDGSTRAEIRARIKVGEDETLLSAPGLHLLTGHAGKGQQFDWVIVAGMEDDSIPFYLAKTPDAVKEEARVLSVMISRARHGVITTYCERLTKPWGDVVGTTPSRFFGHLNASPSYMGWDAAANWLNNASWEQIAQR
ncbi:UvrD-helicase domain-containing protein [Salinibacterium sp. ZJ450]|uniref:UvrD-helicase domain-containing protein n=1 Tax=Salinibacterium sp. ZJ450 TaxID=2708338 RepID=UPI00142088C8|nr:ATP-dependent helicase [Salinibacterium sp. ZJ450]